MCYEQKRYKKADITKSHINAYHSLWIRQLVIIPHPRTAFKSEKPKSEIFNYNHFRNKKPPPSRVTALCAYLAISRLDTEKAHDTKRLLNERTGGRVTI